MSLFFTTPCGYVFQFEISILYIDAKSEISAIRYPRFFHNTYQTFLVPYIRSTDHLCDSCRLTDVSPHFTGPQVLVLFQNKQLLTFCDLMHEMHETAASNCDITMTNCPLVSLDAFLSNWCWNQCLKVFVKYMYMPSFSIKLICGAVNCLAIGVIFD